MTPGPGNMVMLLLLICPAHIIGIWWSMGVPLGGDPNGICRKARRLAELCLAEPGVVAEAAKGARLGLRECGFQFRARRWNCTGHGKGFDRILQQDIRETAFVNAIMAAGVLYAVTKACSMGELPQCGCEDARGRRPPLPSTSFSSPSSPSAPSAAAAAAATAIHQPPSLGGAPSPLARGPAAAGVEVWEWGGCGDDVAFGYDKSRLYMEQQRRRRSGSDIKSLLDRHNHEAGRLALREHTRVECKCHGLSGSCALRTCWRRMPSFRDVGDRLRARFNGAFKVMGSNDGRSLTPVGGNAKPPGARDLLYSARSPDFCAPNRRTGSPGTRGRACNATSPDTGGCELLCCGRGVRRESVVSSEACRCRFQWCCVVHCDKCSVRRDLSVCL
ncbi:protein Wnt-6-like [Petromyzon marinus]|uniref:protein Wnt-6-like n=1 Tax=Petromyzon marinus TaxID=7757 RepID=UPI003F6ED3DA